MPSICLARVIAENIRHEQWKMIKYNHLVAKLVILYMWSR